MTRTSTPGETPKISVLSASERTTRAQRPTLSTVIALAVKSSTRRTASSNRNPDRLKQEHPIQINAARRLQPKGGNWEGLDLERAGRVLRGEEGVRANLQAQAAMAELQRLLTLNREDL